MEGAKFPAILREHWYLISLAIGILLLLGAILNWNWLCDPTGKPESHRYSRSSRRAIFFLLGIVLIVSSLWRCLLTL